MVSKAKVTSVKTCQENAHVKRMRIRNRKCFFFNETVRSNRFVLGVFNLLSCVVEVLTVANFVILSID